MQCDGQTFDYWTWFQSGQNAALLGRDRQIVSGNPAKIKAFYDGYDRPEFVIGGDNSRKATVAELEHVA